VTQRAAPRPIAERASITVQPPDLLELIAHELRTPMTGLYGAAHLLQRAGSTPGVRAELVAELVHDSARLVRFLDDLLALAEASVGVVRVEPVLVQRILSDVVEAIEAEEPGVSIVIRPATVSRPALADPEALRHALANLLGHAVRAMPVGRTVRVTIDDTPDLVTVTVRERVARPGQASGLTDRSDGMVEPGGRLWLAAALALVRSMGGELRVSLRGSTRTMRLALVAASQPTDD
jgi:signal transduction histidine kinase